MGAAIGAAAMKKNIAAIASSVSNIEAQVATSGPIVPPGGAAQVKGLAAINPTQLFSLAGAIAAVGVAFVGIGAGMYLFAKGVKEIQGTDPKSMVAMLGVMIVTIIALAAVGTAA